MWDSAFTSVKIRYVLMYMLIPSSLVCEDKYFWPTYLLCVLDLKIETHWSSEAFLQEYRTSRSQPRTTQLGCCTSFSLQQKNELMVSCLCLSGLLVWMSCSYMSRHITNNRRTLRGNTKWAHLVAHLVFLRSVGQLLVTDSVVPSSPIVVTLTKEALSSSETSVLTRATRRNISEDAILHSHRCENLKSYIEGGWWSASRPCQFTPPRRDPVVLTA
jgi:hypothetical protein